MNSDPKTTPPFDGETATGHTPGSAEGVDVTQGHNQSEREPGQANSSTESVENGALDGNDS
jgi:hypothetical protein